MAHPFTAPIVGYASRLRFPTLLKITLALMVLSWLIPDPIPFLDELVTALGTLLFALWRKPEAPAPAPPREGATLEGESRRQ